MRDTTLPDTAQIPLGRAALATSNNTGAITKHAYDNRAAEVVA